MKSTEFLDIISNMEKPVFTINDALKITGKKPEYIRLYVHRLKKKGVLYEIERGKFALPDHPLSIASNIIFPSYISFFSGLSYYDLTTQIPRTIYVAALKSKKSLDLKGFGVQFIKMGKGRFFGYKKERYRGKAVFIADVEKVIVDSVLLPRYCPIDESFRALKIALDSKKLSQKKLLNYAVRAKSSVALKRLGLMLEILGYDYHKRLGRKLTGKFDKLNPSIQDLGKKNSKWMLYVNEEL